MNLPDYFGLYGRNPTEAEIDRGAKVLRERQMAGQITREWAIVPKSQKRKWLDHAEAVLIAALGGEQKARGE